MTRSTLLCCVLLATGLPAQAEDAKPLGSLDLDLNRLKAWGTREYAYEASHPGSPERAGEGRVILKTGAGPDSVTLVDTAISLEHWLESEELYLKRGFVVECMGREAVGQEDKQVACTKFCLTGGGNHPAFYWVDDDDVLRQVVIDERKWIRLRSESAGNG